MKKLLAMALVLALSLGLAVPALADKVEVVYIDSIDSQLEELLSAEANPELKNIADEPAEVQEFLWQMYKGGMLQENAGYDLSYFEDEVDEYAAYQAAHGEEMAGLDIAQLLADWDYRDMTAAEQFMEYVAEEGESLEEAVTRYYIEQRLYVAEMCDLAREYKADYPQEWESFDADAYFETEWYGYESQAAYRAYTNILTDEEFVDNMFADYIVTYVVDDYGWDYDDDRGYHGEPTLTLMVNGEASAAEITAQDGVSYVDADALREILGAEAVPADQTGPVAVRATAEAAGWDVAWYDGGWWGEDQEVQLWDKDAYEARLAEEFGPLNDFFGKAMKQGMGIIFSDEPLSYHQTVDVALKRFSTLDGDRDYALPLAVDYVAQKGVVDITVTFDLSELLQAVDAKTLAALTGRGGLAAQLTQLLKSGKMEFILDYNEGVMAYNIPLLTLFGEDQAGWKAIDLDSPMGLGEMEEYTFVSTLYATMVTNAEYWGAEEAAAELESTVGALAVFVGKDHFSTQNGKTTWTLTAQTVNKALSALATEDGEVYSFFKAFDLTYTLDDKGALSADMHIRPDMAGIAAAAAAEDEIYSGASILINWILSLYDMDITLGGSGSLNSYASHMSVHWNNMGKLELDSKSTLDKAAQGPRQVDEVAPKFVFTAQ